MVSSAQGLPLESILDFLSLLSKSWWIPKECPISWATFWKKISSFSFPLRSTKIVLLCLSPLAIWEKQPPSYPINVNVCLQCHILQWKAKIHHNYLHQEFLLYLGQFELKFENGFCQNGKFLQAMKKQKLNHFHLDRVLKTDKY